jgi:hypothetical protein
MVGDLPWAQRPQHEHWPYGNGHVRTYSVGMSIYPVFLSIAIVLSRQLPTHKPIGKNEAGMYSWSDIKYNRGSTMH